uniref:Zinc-ribbon 15 domain-containing protein n=1 Tax=Amphora coffeiformis TaxID=265554 RepID=A0A7S3LFU1_9STRA
MFFFFIGGVQPKIHKILQSNYGPCLNCPTGKMDYVEMADTFYAFFLPVYSFSKKNVLHCQDCGLTTTIEKYSQYGMSGGGTAQRMLSPSHNSTTETLCRQCGSPIRGEGWNFCPKCGSQVP